MAEIDSIYPVSNAGMTPPPPMGRGQALTDDQKTQLSEILSKYDAGNMTEKDIRAMRDDIKNADIRPGEELKTILEDSGFQVGPPPMQSTHRPEPPQFVLDFVDKALTGNITEDDVTSFLTQVQEISSNATGIVIDEQF